MSCKQCVITQCPAALVCRVQRRLPLVTLLLVGPPSRGALPAPNIMCAGTASPGSRRVEDTESSLRLPGCGAPLPPAALQGVGERRRREAAQHLQWERH